MEIAAKCNSCGGTKFLIPEDHDADKVIHCASCNTPIGTREEVRKALAEKGKKEISDMLKRSFKSGKGFKLK